MLSEIGPAIVHIYGQHEHHTLLKPETHIELLDAFGGLSGAVELMGEKFSAFAGAWAAVKHARQALEERRKERGLLESQVEEIAKARLRENEEAELQAKKNILVHAEKLYQGCRQGEELLYEGDNALIAPLGRYGNKLKELAQVDGALTNAAELLQGALAQLEEASMELRRYAGKMHFEPGALDQLEDRLAELHRLKRKYNGGVEDILRVQAQAQAELQALDRGEGELPIWSAHLKLRGKASGKRLAIYPRSAKESPSDSNGTWSRSSAALACPRLRLRLSSSNARKNRTSRPFMWVGKAQRCRHR